MQPAPHAGLIPSPRPSPPTCRAMTRRSPPRPRSSCAVRLGLWRTSAKLSRRTDSAHDRHVDEGRLPVFAALIATVLGAGAALMLSDAVNSHSVIVDVFKAPAALASNGLTGDVVAGELLDELTRLQAATRSNAAKRRLDNDWSGDIKVDIPETGISIGEIGRLLHQRFGHDMHIGGDLVQTGTGDLTLTVRGDGVLPKAFTGAGDLGKLTTEAAEYVYSESQPGLFIHYLTDVSRNDEAIAFAKSHLARARLADRPDLLNYWANAINAKAGPHSMAEGLPLYREAIRIQPGIGPAITTS